MIGDAERIGQLNPEERHVVLTRASFVTESGKPGEAAIPTDDPAESVAVQIFTSGTTAAPKAAVLRHANLLSYILGTVEFASAASEEAALVSVPPYHIAGIAALLSSIYALRRIVLLPAFDPDVTASAALAAAGARDRYAFQVPTMLSRIIGRLDASPSADLTSLRALSYGGGRMPMELIDRALQLFPNTGFTNAYGLTETSSTIALLGPDEHREAHSSTDPAARARLGSVGRPLPTVQIEIRDEIGKALGPGERGEIYVRGEETGIGECPSLNAVRWMPKAGFGNTRCRLDGLGGLSCFLPGARTMIMIVRGGENISPGEIEAVLMSHPVIADAAAVAVPSLEWGEAVGIAVVSRSRTRRRPPQDELRTLIRSRLRSSRVPERIAILDALPYNEMGKLLRREVKKLFN